MKKIVYIDIDDTLADRKAAYERARSLNPAMPFPQAEHGFYAGLKPLDGAIDAVDWLLNSAQFSPYILTAPSIMNPMSYTEKRVWVENHLGMDMVNRLIISPDKSLLRGDYLIDDNVTGHGQDAFNGELLHFGSPQLPDWRSVISRLRADSLTFDQLRSI